MSVMQTYERASFSGDDISLLHRCRGMSQFQGISASSLDSIRLLSFAHKVSKSLSRPLLPPNRCDHSVSMCVQKLVGRRASKELPRLFRSFGRYGAAIICCSPAFKRWVLQLAVIPNVYIKAPTKLHHVSLLLLRWLPNLWHFLEG